MPACPLLRERHSVDVHDDDAPRTWLCGVVRDEVRLRGEPNPRIVALGDEVRYVVDLTTLRAADPTASVALTLGVLATRSDVHRVFLVVRLEGEDTTGTVRRAAFVYEREADGRYWSAALSYTVDPASGVGDPDGDWTAGAGTEAALPPFLAVLLGVAPGDRPAELALARPRAPDIRAAFGVLPEHLPLPSDATQQAALTAAMVGGEVVRDGLLGVVVLRLAGSAWEWWVLGEGLPTDLDDMVRVICAREPTPDGVAVVQLARFDGPGEAAVGVQIVAERGGARAERWMLLAFPAGPTGPRQVGKVLARTLPLPEEGGWIGVAPEVEFDLAAIGG